MNQIKRRIIIEGGKVHNVGYRPFLLAKARKLGISNYEADNVEEDDKQEVIVSVAGEERQIREFMDFAKENYPKKAEVDRIWEDSKPPERVMPIDEYDKVLAAEQQNTIVQTGLGMLRMQKRMLDKQDKTIEEIKVVGEKVDAVGEKVDIVGEKVDQGFEKTDQDFSTIRQDYGKISHTMEEILDRLTQQQKDFTEAINGLTKAILKLAEKSAK